MRMISANSLQPVWNLRNPKCHPSSSSPLFHNSKQRVSSDTNLISFGYGGEKWSISQRRARTVVVRGSFLPVDPWAPNVNVDSQSIASQLFAFSLFPYLGFLYYITKSKSAPKLTLFGFYFLLAFVGATSLVFLDSKVHYGTSLSNVDWLHGSAESLLTLSNLFVVLGLREALRKLENIGKTSSDLASDIEKETSST
ncbi:OLC1v1029995C1 [Oldenlandia corymbosa var. corymbosa]|uniref:OLC1v1029995C1 n=1 Tax=Oldenlandia corymbosa var. corymbosa TaxID=529605 RepID=A0AAV1CGW6_OLDCO|nr:OLC1v1029995C1 [Oldenlandia corymbosa var. corymbosa]